MKRMIFDIETEPFSKEFIAAASITERRKHAPRLRLACVYIQATRKYCYFVPETVSKLIFLLQSANEVVSYNGKNFDVLVLERHYQLKGSVPNKGTHADLFEILLKEAGFRVSLDKAAHLNLRERKLTDGRKMNILSLDELKVACRSDVSQTYRLWKLYKTGKLRVPEKPEKEFSSRFSEDSYEMDLGHHMPDKCPNCGAAGSLEFVGWDTEGMTDGQLADYEAGFYGSAFCSKCNKVVDFGF